MRDSDWTRIVGWPGYRVYKHEINEEAKILKLWWRRKSGKRKLVCSGCGRRVNAVHEVYERETRDLPCFEFRTTVVMELYRVRWVNLTSGKGRGLSTLLALNRNLLKGYVLKKSPGRLSNYRYEGAMLRYPRSWIDQLRWQRLPAFQELAAMLQDHLFSGRLRQ